MKVQIEKTFPMPASADIAWALLQDIEGVAGCMPGAAITERTDAGHYKGTVAVRVGPASMSFRGTVEVKDVDVATRTMRLLGKGTDSTGTSGASMELTARIEAPATRASDACALIGVSEVAMSGKAATFGARMMGGVADQVLKQFAANFASKAQEMQARQSALRPVAGAPLGATEASAAGRHEINALALLWAAFSSWFRGLFQSNKR